MNKFEQECLDTHNQLRRLHGSPDLEYNKDIAAISQKWAENIAKDRKLEHNPDRKHPKSGEQMGENVVYLTLPEEPNGEEVVQNWYSEIKDYDFDQNCGAAKPGVVTVNFTQVVWKDSKELGVGRAQASNGYWYVVANYSPAGNYVGQFEKNVLPKARMLVF